MWSSQLFWRVFLVYAALTVVSAAAFARMLFASQRTIVFEQAEQRLHDSAILLGVHLRGAFSGPLDPKLPALLKRLEAENGTRITLIAADGRVLADSSADSESMENHANRPEVLEARQSRFGTAYRQSGTLELPMIYFALRLGELDAPEGYLRLGLSASALHEQISDVAWKIWGTALSITLLALGITYLVVGWIIRPLETLTGAAEQMAAGDLTQQVTIRSRNEIGTLARAFNSMTRELAARIDQLQSQSRELEQKHGQLATVLGAMVEGVLAVDDRERVLLANDAALRLLEIKRRDIVGRPIWEAVRHPALQRVVKSALAGEDPQREEFELPRSQHVIAMLASRLSGSPGPGVLLVLQDITELRRLESMRREFVSNVSHELKTPLTSITAYTETLLEGALEDPENNRKFLHRIEEQADRLHVLILDLLNLARIESESAAYEVAPVEVGPIVQECLEDHAGVAESKQIVLTIEGAEERIRVLADPEGLRTILDNLLDNALNYTPAGGSVTVRCRPDGEMAEIAVHDTGVGIARENQARIFERFYRVDKARSRELGGTGLGLSIVKHLCQLFGGTIRVASQLGQGSTFVVRLRMVGGDAPAANEQQVLEHRPAS